MRARVHVAFGAIRPLMCLLLRIKRAIGRLLLASKNLGAPVFIAATDVCHVSTIIYSSSVELHARGLSTTFDGRAIELVGKS